MTEQGKLRAAIYSRLSDEDRDKKMGEDSESIVNQKNMLIKFAVDQGWEIYDIYSDDDYSGADRDRPDWNRMICDCEDGKIDIVLCKSQSRFSREVEVIEKYLHGKFIEWSVRFVSITDHADTADYTNKKARQVNSLMNEWYLEDLSTNIRRTMKHKRESGEWVGSFAPYGYMRDPENKHRMIVDPVAANIVREIFTMYRDGKGYIAIAKALNARQIPNPSQYKKACGINFKTQTNRATSKVWTDSTIYVILRREEYTGTLIQGRQEKVSFKSDKRKKVSQDKWAVKENAHEAIIEPELWEAVQRRLKSHSKQSYSGEVHILAGKVFCAVCRNTMWKMSYALSKGRYKYLKCKSVKNDPDLCHNRKSIRLDVLHEIILSQINQMIADYYDPNLVEIQEAKKSAADERIRPLEIEEKDLVAHLGRHEDKMRTLYEDKYQGLIDINYFKTMSKQFSEDVEKCNNRLSIIRRQIADLKGGRNRQPVNREELFAKYEHIDDLTREIVDEFIEAIYIGPMIEPENQRPIEIQWTFE